MRSHIFFYFITFLSRAVFSIFKNTKKHFPVLTKCSLERPTPRLMMIMINTVFTPSLFWKNSSVRSFQDLPFTSVRTFQKIPGNYKCFLLFSQNLMAWTLHCFLSTGSSACSWSISPSTHISISGMLFSLKVPRWNCCCLNIEYSIIQLAITSHSTDTVLNVLLPYWVCSVDIYTITRPRSRLISQYLSCYNYANYCRAVTPS